MSATFGEFNQQSPKKGKSSVSNRRRQLLSCDHPGLLTSNWRVGGSQVTWGHESQRLQMSCDLDAPAAGGRKDGQWTAKGRGRKGRKSVGREGATVRKQC